MLERKSNQSVGISDRSVGISDHRGLWLFAIALLVIALDQYTKHLVRTCVHLPLNKSWNPIPWLDRIVTLTHVRNSGVAFGFLPNMGTIFIGVAAIVVLLIVFCYRQLAKASWLLHVAFGLQLGGAIGNMIDRITDDGHVTDFIDFRVWPVFNVADSAVVVGTILLAFYIFFLDRPEEEAAAGNTCPDGET